MSHNVVAALVEAVKFEITKRSVVLKDRIRCPVRLKQALMFPSVELASKKSRSWPVVDVSWLVSEKGITVTEMRLIHHWLELANYHGREFNKGALIRADRSGSSYWNAQISSNVFFWLEGPRGPLCAFVINIQSSDGSICWWCRGNIF